MILVFAIGLLEIPVYLFGIFRMAQLHEIRWWRELSLGATIVAGLLAGQAVHYAALALFPKL